MCVRKFLAETHPTIHVGEVLVADSVDGHNLEKDGVFKMVSTEEKRPARCAESEFGHHGRGQTITTHQA